MPVSVCFLLQVQRQAADVAVGLKRTDQQLNQLHQERGRKETEHKVSYPLFHFLYYLLKIVFRTYIYKPLKNVPCMCFQHHLEKVKSRDAEVTSLSGQLHLEGYKAPFSTESVKQFLSETSQRIRDREERARQEKVGMTATVMLPSYHT